MAGMQPLRQRDCQCCGQVAPSVKRGGIWPDRDQDGRSCGGGEHLNEKQRAYPPPEIVSQIWAVFLHLPGAPCAGNGIHKAWFCL
jgi:hypothetical protein